MNVVLCADDKYAMPCGVCLTSLFENNKNISFDVYIFTENLSDREYRKFENLAKAYSQKLSIIRISSDSFENLKVSERFSKAIYYRFLIPNILVQDKFALYLDCDIIINGSLSFFETINIEDYACAVIKDQMCDDIRLSNRIQINTPYFNSGVIYMNLDYWRKNNISMKCINYIYEYPELCLYPDQDALNKILGGKVIYIPIKYNFQELFYANKEKVFFRRDLWNEVDEYKENPVIIHYTSNIKPWYKESTHPLKRVFIKYRDLSPWKGKEQVYFNIKRRYLFLRSNLKKIFYIVILGKNIS